MFMWYKKYLSIYAKPFEQLPEGKLVQIKEKMDKLQSNNPIASVVIIAYNESKHLAACLWSLSETKCKYPIEIIGVDNNSTDQTAQIFKECGVKYVLEPKQGHGNARNAGLDLAKGDYYICIDSDTLYPPFYIETIIEAMKMPNVVAAVARYGFIKDKGNSAISLFLYEFFRDLSLRYKAINRPELAVRGLVFAVKTELAKQVGGFRVDLKRGEDGSMALAVKPYGTIKFIHKKKSNAITGLRIISADGSLFSAFIIRAKKVLKEFFFYLRKEKADDYKDQESNLR